MWGRVEEKQRRERSLGVLKRGKGGILYKVLNVDIEEE